MVRKVYLLVAFIVLLHASRTDAQPIINSFTPGKGPAGSTVIISGSNFNPIPASNFVYFGPVRGGVISGTSNSLTVNVPGGTSNQPVSVFDFATKLTGFANKPFVTTFNGSPTFTPTSFSPKYGFLPNNGGSPIAVADITLDQKPDIVVLQGSARSFSVYQNNSTTANPAFTSTVFPVATTGSLQGMAVADFNGDGRKDVAMTDSPSQLIVVRNETPGGGQVAFGETVKFVTDTQPYAVVTADIDRDGKIDIVLSNRNSKTISVFRNITTTATISFAPKVDFAVGDEVRGLAVGDLDDDGKVDIVACNRISGTVSVLKNTTTGSTISFAAKNDFSIGGNPENVAVGDLDDDGKLDIAVANSAVATVSVLRNTSSVGTISFVAKIDFPARSNLFDISIADLNGDGKMDILTSNDPLHISVFGNTSTPGTLAFQLHEDYGTLGRPGTIIPVDVDLDGRLDIALGMNGIEGLLIFMNIVTNQPPCAATASITGQACIGSVLNVASNQPINSVSWMLNGSVVAVHKAGLQNQSTLVAGGNGSGIALNQLSSPNRLYVDKDGVLYIPDMANNRIVKWLPGATAGTVIAGGNGAGSQPNQFDKPTCVAMDALGNIYVADQNNNRIQKWAPGAASGTTVAAGLGMPTGIFVDAQNNLYVAEQANYRVLKFAPGSATGIVVAGGHGQGSASNQFASPTGIYVDAAGNLFICDTDNNRVQKWAPGAATGTTAAKGPGLTHPLGVYVDPEGNLYVSDYTGGNVQKWLPGASAGIIIINGASNMGAIKPQGLWMDSNNSLYITDFTQHRVLRFENIFTGSYTVTKSGTYSAQVASAAGCAITTNSIVVPDNPVTDLKVSSNSSIICPAVTPVFTASVTSAGPAPLFQWKINGSNSGPLSASTTFSPAGLKVGDKISCDASLTNSCGYAYQVSANTITMTDVPQSSPSITVTPSASAFCAGTEVTLSSAVTNAGSSPSFQWIRNGQLIPGATSATYTSKAFLNGDKISCEVTSNEQCQASTKATSNQVALVVMPVITSEISIKSDVMVIYEKTSVTFTASVVNAAATSAFEWKINGQIVGENKPTFTTRDLAEGDQITCQLTSTGTCVSQAAVLSNIITINITPVLAITPPSVFTPNGDAVNDTWEIPGISAFPQSRIKVFNRYGSEVYNSVGYQKAWNGEYNGVALPLGVYYYSIVLGNGTTVKGNVTVLR